jgi:hypothetical protein
MTGLMKDDALRERLTRSADAAAAEPGRTWPALERAMRRDRSMRRARTGAAATLAAALVTTLVLPFTPVRVEPVDRIAAAIGLRDADSDRGARVPDGFIQPDVPRGDRYRAADGPALPAPSGDPVTDTAWLTAAEQRARHLVKLSPWYGDENRDPEGYRPRALWSTDDGTTRHVVVGFMLDEDIVSTWAVLSGPSGGSADQLTVSSTAPELATREPVEPVTRPRLVAASLSGDEAPAAAALPTVDADGLMTTTWHPLTRVSDDLFVGYLTMPTVNGYTLDKPGTASVNTPGESPWRLVPRPGAATGGSPTEDLLANSPLGAVAGLGYAGTSRTVSMNSELFGAGQPGTFEMEVRMAGVKSPGGGWLVTGDATITEAGLRRLNPGSGITRSQVSYGLAMVSAPATTGGGSPFTGIALTRAGYSGGYALLWAPSQVVSVRSGSVTAGVVDGLAVVDLDRGGERAGRGTPTEQLLVEGLDAEGHVIARTWVRTGVRPSQD